MTKYKEMPLDTQIEAGDRVTLSGPSEGELTTRNVKEGGRVFVTNDTVNTLYALANYSGLALIKIERPAPAVPTVPGYYESAEFPISNDCYAYRLNSTGHWYDGITRVDEDYMRELMPLTRLVPQSAPAKLAARLDDYKVGLRMNHIRNDNKFYSEEGAELIAAIENGELDK